MTGWYRLLDHMPVSVIVTDAEGEVVRWNRHAEQLFGWTEEEARGRQILELTVPPENVDLARDIMATLGRGGTWEGQFRACRRDGGAVDIHIVNAPLGDHDGEVTGVIGVAVDVTSAVEAERRLREVLDRERETAEERAAVERLRRRFIEATSHELRTPLAQILAGIGLLDDPHTSDEQRGDLRALVRRQAQHLHEVVERMLDLQRADETELRIAPAPLRVDELVADVVGRADLPDHPVELDLEPVHARIDRELVAEVIGHLLDNVCRHTPAGTPAHVRVSDAGDRVTIEVGDAGPGLPEALRRELVEPFVMGSVAGAGRLGVGLTIVRHLVELHAGELELSATDGGGALVRVVLPLVP